MAYSLIRQTLCPENPTAGTIRVYICDTVADVANLPTGEDGGGWDEIPAPGSTALVAETKEIYALTPARTWMSVAVLP